jgi:hypothetical protein
MIHRDVIRGWIVVFRLVVLFGLVAWPLMVLLAAAVAALGVIVWRANW